LTKIKSKMSRQRQNCRWRDERDGQHSAWRGEHDFRSKAQTAGNGLSFRASRWKPDKTGEHDLSDISR
jgi:hypothetical protein